MIHTSRSAYSWVERTSVLAYSMSKIEFIKRTQSCVLVDNPGIAIMMHGYNGERRGVVN